MNNQINIVFNTYPSPKFDYKFNINIKQIKIKHKSNKDELI